MCAQINVQPNPLFLTSRASGREMNTAPHWRGTTMAARTTSWHPSLGWRPAQARKKRKSQFALGTVKTGQHGDYSQMEDIMIGCAVTPFPLFFKLCGGLIKSASSLRPLMLQCSLIKSHSRKHTIHQLRTNFVDVNGWSVQSGNVPSCPWSRRNHEMIFSDQGAGNWIISQHHREKTAITARRGLCKCLTHSPLFLVTSSHSYLAMKKTA